MDCGLGSDSDYLVFSIHISSNIPSVETYTILLHLELSVEQDPRQDEQMAHIADFLVEKPSTVGLNNFIARELSPSPPHDTVRSSYLKSSWPSVAESI